MIKPHNERRISVDAIILQYQAELFISASLSDNSPQSSLAPFQLHAVK